MVKPADLVKHLKYDTMDSAEHPCAAHLQAQEYLKECKYEIHSVLNGEIESEEPKTIVTRDNISYTTYLTNVNTLNSLPELGSSQQWRDLPMEVKNGILKKITNGIVKYAETFAGLESLSRNIPAEDVLKYDIPLITQHFNYYADAPERDQYEGKKFKEQEVMVFTEECCLGALGMAVSCALALGVSVVVLASETVAAIAHLFANICQNSGVPPAAICVCLVQEKHLQQFIQSRTSDVHRGNYNHLLKSESGCTVVVTESGDVDSAIDMLGAQSTCNRVYPWRVDRLFVQESIYEGFKKKLEKKFFTALATDVTPPKATRTWTSVKAYEDSAARCIISENGWRGEATTRMQAFRSSRELLGLLHAGETPLALALWCDSVSVSNEIALAANVPIVWINTYGLFDASVSMRVRQPVLKIFGGNSGLANYVKGSADHSNSSNLPSEEDTALELKECVKSLKKMLPSWSSRPHCERLAVCVDAVKLFTQQSESKEVDLWRAILEEVRAKEEGGAVRVVRGMLRVHTCEPVGVALATCPLGRALAAVVHGDALIFSIEDHVHRSPTLCNFLQYLNGKGVPMVPCAKNIQTVRSQALKLHEIKSVDTFGVSCSLYYTKVIWSPIGETFAN